MDNEQNKKRFINLAKKVNNKFIALNVDNALLSGMRTPKIVFTAVQPAPEDANQKYVSAKYFLNVTDALAVANAIIRTKVDKEQTLFKGYQGGNNKRRSGVEARVLTITAKPVNGKTFYSFVIENTEGVQGTIKNGDGEDVPGVVKPKSGGKVFAKCSFGASKNEAMYVAEMIRMEIQAWRTAVNVDMKFYPAKYRYNSNAVATSNIPAVMSKPLTA